MSTDIASMSFRDRYDSHVRLDDSEVQTALAIAGCIDVRHIPFRVYVNPMRDDGLFVAEDRPPQTYPTQTHLTYAVPPDAPGVPGQLPHHVAHAVVELLNRRIKESAS